MRINYLTSSFDGSTGGLIYDEALFKNLAARFGEPTLIDDTSFSMESSWIRPGFLRFSRLYSRHKRDIQNADWLFINSRLYTRFLSPVWVLADSSNVKVAIIHHHFNFMSQDGIRSKIHKALEMRMLNRSDLIVTPNIYTYDLLDQMGFGSKICLVQAELSRNLTRAALPDSRIISFVGTVEPRKGLEFGIRAFAEFSKRHRGYEYHIAGSVKSSRYLASLRKLAADLAVADGVQFLGRISDRERDRLLSHSCLFLFPSQNEGYGHVLIEAMSHGLPVVAFDNTAMPYSVNELNGRLIQNQNVLGMASAIEEILMNHDLWDRLSAGAKDTVHSLPTKAEIQREIDTLFDKL